jgi:hypothetical protein
MISLFANSSLFLVVIWLQQEHKFLIIRANYYFIIMFLVKSWLVSLLKSHFNNPLFW